jgi:hypothetical protein
MGLEIEEMIDVAEGILLTPDASANLRPIGNVTHVYRDGLVELSRDVLMAECGHRCDSMSSTTSHHGSILVPPTDEVDPAIPPATVVAVRPDR